jgi:lysophospholipase L1-like esterase/dienelactone hydrolase
MKSFLSSVLAISVGALTLLTATLAEAQITARKSTREKTDPSFAAIADDPSLPRILLIGDSISMGYTLPVRMALTGKANVHRPPDNCGPTTRGLEKLDQWLGKGPWEVIHFNFGLHDLKLIEGKHLVSPRDYEKNLRAIVNRLQKTGATLIWCSTTPVPQKTSNPPRSNDDVIAYNAVAKKVMEENQIAIDDLYGFALPRLKKIQRPANVHYSGQGYQLLAGRVVEDISKAIEQRKAQPGKSAPTNEAVAQSSATPSIVTLDGMPAARSNPTWSDGHIHRVEKPVLHIMPTAVAAPKGTILLCPGGGYGIIAIGHEGVATAEFLNKQGFDAAILEYTIASGATTRDRALSDALAAWRLIKGATQRLGLHGRRFGVMGYSAGGHLAARLTSYLPAKEQPNDVILIYPAYLQEAAPGTFIAAVRPPSAPTGRLFVLIAANDNPQWVSSCREYAAVWKETGGESRLEVLTDGGHGFGMKPDLPGDAKRWPKLLADFLRTPPVAKLQANPAEAVVRQPGWSDRHRQKCAAVAKEKFDLILIGASITHNFEKPEYQPVWNQFFAPRHALNLGYSGARTENILWNIGNGELNGQSPKVITLMIGGNNADAKNFPTHHNAEQIAGGIKAIVGELKAKCPNAKILLLRCFPSAYGGPGAAARRATLDRASELAAKLADNKRVFFCDVNHVFLNLDGSIKNDLMPDGLHPSPQGARRWARAMEPLLFSLMGDASHDTEKPANTAIVPVPKLEDDSYDWWARHDEVLGVQRAIDPDIVLIGDSITHFWGGEPKSNQANGPKSFASVFAPYRVLNLGFGWDRTQNVLWRLDHGELDGLHPRAVVIHIGSNNTSQTDNARANSPAEIVEGIAAICSRVRSKVPGVRIILMQVFPREETPEHPRRAQIAEINRLLAEFAGANRLDLVDLASKMLRPDGTLHKDLMPDFCHPNEKGYEIWADALRPLLPPAICGGHLPTTVPGLRPGTR